MIVRIATSYFAAMLLAASAAAQTILVDTSEDRADAPFNAVLGCGQGTTAQLPGTDGRVSLREALIAANDTPGPQTIRFAPALAGSSIRITFDGNDTDLQPNPLPPLCSGDTIVDGDIDGDGVPDVTIDGSALPAGYVGFDLASSNNTVAGLRLRNFDFAIYLGHPRSVDDETVRSGNHIRGNDIRASRFGIYLVAGQRTVEFAGAIAQTSIEDNQVTGAGEQAISVHLQGAAASVQAIEISDNLVHDNPGFGIVLVAESQIASATMTDVLVARNEVTRCGGTGIFVGPSQGVNDVVMTGIELDDNRLDNPASPGIYVAGGSCGSTYNAVAVGARRNDFASGSQGLRAEGASNQGCAPATADSHHNQVQLAIADNQLVRTPGNAIDLIGGNSGAALNQLDADVARNLIDRPTVTGIRAAGGLRRSGNNRVNLTATANVVSASEFIGINLIAGSSDDTGVAAENLVVGSLRANRVDHAGFVGIALLGASGDRVRNNRLDAVLDGNRACGSQNADVRCLGFSPTPPVVDASNNIVFAQLAATQAGTVAADPANSGGLCNVQQSGTRPCTCQGDCGGNAMVTVEEVITLVNIALGNGAADSCVAGDANGDDQITVEEIVGALVSALSGC